MDDKKTFINVSYDQPEIDRIEASLKKSPVRTRTEFVRILIDEALVARGE